MQTFSYFYFCFFRPCLLQCTMYNHVDRCGVKGYASQMDCSGMDLKGLCTVINSVRLSPRHTSVHVKQVTEKLQQAEALKELRIAVYLAVSTQAHIAGSEWKLVDQTWRELVEVYNLEVTEELEIIRGEMDWRKAVAGILTEIRIAIDSYDVKALFDGLSKAAFMKLEYFTTDDTIQDLLREGNEMYALMTRRS